MVYITDLRRIRMFDGNAAEMDSFTSYTKPVIWHPLSFFQSLEPLKITSFPLFHSSSFNIPQAQAGPGLECFFTSG